MSRKRNENDEFPHYELIIADNNSEGKKRMTVLTAKSLESELIEMDCSGMKEDMIIDLNREGRRWEGGELNGKPFGFGVEYSEEGNLVYEGFEFEGMRVCVGKEWNDNENNNCIMYEGGYCNGERWGKGKSYDLNGKVDFEGEWMNNRAITESERNDLKDYSIFGNGVSFNGGWASNGEKHLGFSISIEKLTFHKGEDNNNVQYDEIFDISPMFIRLKEIIIDKGSFPNVYGLHICEFVNLEIITIGASCFVISVGENTAKKIPERVFKIANCPKLQRIAIGRMCFSIKGDIDDREYDDGLCCINNCHNLQELEIGDNSFGYFTSFELSNVDSLKSIKFGKKCFMITYTLLLKSKLIWN